MTAIGKPTYEELEKKCALLQSKLAAMNELMNVVGKASDIVNVGAAELQSQNAELAVQLANAEPVADVVDWHKEGEERTCDIRWRRFDVSPGPLYAVPPKLTSDNL